MNDAVPEPAARTHAAPHADLPSGSAAAEAGALVLGGGGVAGIAWLTGLLLGLAEGGLDMSGADPVIGTSAGSVVAAQLLSGVTLEELYARQTEPGRQVREIAAEFDPDSFGEQPARLLASPPATPAEHAALRRAAGAFAMAAETVALEARRAVIAERLPSHDWPSGPGRDLRITAVCAETGELRVFDRASGVPLVDAVAASCAVPGIWPAVPIGGEHYMDGGVRSNDNADLALGASRVLVLSPLGEVGLFPSEAPLDQSVAGLRAAGARVAVVTPDEASREAFGPNPLDPATRRPAAEAGRAQGLGLGRLEGR